MTGGAARAVAVAFAIACAPVAFAQHAGSDARRSGFDYASPSTQAMQRDDLQNPAMLWVGDGEAAWSRKAGGADKACADCHGAAATSMRGVAARYPAIDPRTQRPQSLAQRIGVCVQDRQRVPALAPESEALLGLEAYVALQSRGMPIAPPGGAEMDAARERGRALYHRRMGQVDLACAQCHDANAGRRLAGSTIPEAHPTGYPLYRLEWQGVGSLQRRLRGCLTGIRAEPYAYGAAELVDLEAFLMQRAAGMPLDAPGVRP